MEEKINTDSKEHAVEILQQLNEYRKTGRHCDFMIKAGSEELPVHKNIMSASTTVNNLRKNAINLHCNVSKKLPSLMSWMDLDEKFISFLMESNETKAKEEGKCKMLLAWTKHDIDERKECFLGLVMKFQLTKMTLSYRRFLVENEPLIFESMQSIQSLTLSILDSHGDISSKDFNLPKNKQLVVFDQTSQRIHSLDVADKTWTPMQTMDQAIIKKLYSAVMMESYIYVICTNKLFYRLEYAESNAKWEQMANTNLQYACVVALDGFVYGIEYGKSSNIMERYDPSNNRWTRLANKSLILACESLVAADGKVFCIAGQSKQQYRATNQVEIYDPVTSTWSMDNRSLNEARYYASATATEEGIYVIGGYVNGKSLLTTVEFRSSVTKAWVMLKPMKTARHWFGSCVIDEEVYVIGGNGNPANIEEYDPEIKEWKIIETIPGKNIFPRATVAISI
ncbi:kelch-like protein 23 [Styela clava]